MQKARTGTTQRNRKNVTCKFQPVSVEAEAEQWAAGSQVYKEPQGREPNEKDL